MTTLPRPLTVAEYARLGETEIGYTELRAGRVLTNPTPAVDHAVAAAGLSYQLFAALPDGLELIPRVDIDLRLAPTDGPGFSRRPDLVIVTAAALARVRAAGGLLLASEVVLAVEIVSPCSERTDTVVKPREYADAGIPHYWVVAPPVSLRTWRLAGSGYQDSGTFSGAFRLLDPFPVDLDLPALL